MAGSPGVAEATRVGVAELLPAMGLQLVVV